MVTRHYHFDKLKSYTLATNVVYHYLGNDHYFIQFRFKLIQFVKYDDSDSKSNNIT
jgi:hypothetical protein